MKKKRHPTEEIIRILRKADEGQTVEEVCREVNISEQTFYRWRRKYGRMEMADAKRFKELENENSELKEMGICTIYIDPGSPWQNGHVESFHNRLRDECLNQEVFLSVTEARVVIEEWRGFYNRVHPHSGLGFQSPDGFARTVAQLEPVPGT